MSSIKEEAITKNDHSVHSENIIQDEAKEGRKDSMKYETWFLVHSGMKKKEDLCISDLNNNLEEFASKDEIWNMPYETKADIHDYAAWFHRHSVKRERISEKEESDGFKSYTPICKKYYPLIINPVDKNVKKNYDICSENFFFYCFTCDENFSPESKTNHKEHSIINLDEIKIGEEKLIEEENSIRGKISSLFNKNLEENPDEESNEIIKKSIEEIIKFNYYVINSYRRDKNNFYKYFNYYYLFRLKEDLKNDEDNLVKKFFGFHGFKIIVNDLKIFYEKAKLRWLLRNLISYRKNELRQILIKKRKKDYKFENLDTLLLKEGFEENIISKMKEIIKEAKNEEFKNRIFNFIVESVEAFKNNQDKYLKELNLIA